MKIKNRSVSAVLLAFALSTALLSSVLISSVFISTSATATVIDSTHEPLSPLPDHINTTRNIVDALANGHYVPTVLDDKLSLKIFNRYLRDLDPSKSYLLAADIENFQRVRFDLDDALRRGDVRPAFEIFNVYHRRVIDRFEKVIIRLEKGIDDLDFKIDEELLIDRSEIAWASTETELDNLWRKRIKNAVLNLKLADKENDKIQELLLKRYKNRLARTLQTNSEDVYQLYMNSFTRTYDPHTQYFSPRTSENFNINMSLSLEGIGAVLQREDEFTKVVSLVPAGPADKSKQLFPDDKIIAVGQGVDGEMVDVIGWRLDEVVQLIRGKKNTVVKLDIVSASATESGSKVIEITRNTVKLEEQSAKSEIIEVEQFGAIRKIGIIDIPTFYVDFKALQQNKANYKSTTRDVKRLLVELMKEGIEGVVIDLRNNGGGSLQEAKTLTGLFIDRGPTVQIRSKSNRVDVLNDRDRGTVYDGPLAVLVNRLSASASEIFAGAIQDYERGLIIGSQTFGKGTVQALRPLNRGQLKLTQAKFYRISGESTQHKGILPDIFFPNNFDPESIGESTLDDPLPWDEIPAAGYRTKRSIVPLLNELRALHDQRAENDPEFVYLQNALAYRQERRGINSVSLNEQQRLAEKSKIDAFWLKLENDRRQAQGLQLLGSLDELDTIDNPVAKNATLPGVPVADANQDGSVDNSVASNTDVNATIDSDDSVEASTTPKSKPDAYLIEASNIILDYLMLEKRVAEEKEEKGQSI